MKPDPAYTKKLLEAFEDSPQPTTDIQESSQTALHWRE
jgi:hypothetical protein